MAGGRCQSHEEKIGLRNFHFLNEKIDFGSIAAELGTYDEDGKEERRVRNKRERAGK
jgi:hypothetical protein